MILAPAYAGAHPPGTLLGGLLKDHDAGKNPAKNPGHYDLKVNTVGNWTSFAVTETSSGTAAIGFGLINGSSYVHAVTLHSFNDCQGKPADCSGYLPHGHGGQLGGPTANCTAIFANAELTGVVDFGKVKVTVAGDESSSVVEVKKIPADSRLGLLEQVCDTGDIVDVADITAFEIVVGSGGELCIFVDDPRSTTVDGADGPENKNRAGGFDLADPQCLVPVLP